MVRTILKETAGSSNVYIMEQSAEQSLTILRLLKEVSSVTIGDSDYSYSDDNLRLPQDAAGVTQLTIYMKELEYDE
jgi:hypothetical protein